MSVGFPKVKEAIPNSCIRIVYKSSIVQEIIDKVVSIRVEIETQGLGQIIIKRELEVEGVIALIQYR